MNLNIVTSIDDLADLLTENKEELNDIFGIKKDVSPSVVKEILKRFIVGIDDGDTSYFRNNSNLLRIEADYPKGEMRVLKSRKIEKSTPILGICINRLGTEYRLFYNLGNIPADFTYPVIDCIEDIKNQHKMEYQDNDPNLISVTAEKKGYIWLVTQKQTIVSEKVIKSIVSRNDKKYISMYRVRR